MIPFSVLLSAPGGDLLYVLLGILFIALIVVLIKYGVSILKFIFLFFLPFDQWED